MRKRRSLFFLCAALMVAGRASAAELLVDWQAPPCAAEAEFRSRVESALRRRPDQVLRSDLQVSVKIGENAQGTGFVLWLSTADGSRQLETATCAEAVAAAAVIV